MPRFPHYICAACTCTCRYEDFPFDRQTITTQLNVPGAHLFTCHDLDAFQAMGLTDENAQMLLLPSTGTWLLDGPLAKARAPTR